MTDVSPNGRIRFAALRQYSSLPSLSFVRRLIRCRAVPALDVMVFAQIVFADPSVEVGRLTPAVETSTWFCLRVRLSPKSRFS